MYEKGVYVSDVRTSSPAQKAGLKTYDRILQVCILVMYLELSKILDSVITEGLIGKRCMSSMFRILILLRTLVCETDTVIEFCWCVSSFNISLSTYKILSLVHREYDACNINHKNNF